MNKLAHFFETERGKRIKNLIIGLGASVVLMGALFKLQHWQGASQMLIAGMCTEAFIFALLGILPPHKDYYWEKIYPELDMAPDEEELRRVHSKALHGGKGITAQLDSALESGKVEPELVKRLGDNLKKLGENIEKMNNLGDAGSATKEYADKARGAAVALEGMKDAYKGVSEAMAKLQTAQNETTKYHEQVQLVSKNLSQLNAIYELELQDTNNHLKAMNKFYGSLSQAMDNLTESVEDTKKYRSEMSGLAKNLSQLNNVYGNMLSAMQMGGVNTNSNNANANANKR
jgi:gliding motility-associated protein GldL